MRVSTALFLCAAACVFPGPALAAPYVNVRMVVHGGPHDGEGVIVVTPGQTVNYRLTAQMAPVGTTNSAQSLPDDDVLGHLRMISELDPAQDGINAVRLNIFQRTSAAIQVDFTAPATLDSLFNMGTGRSPGTLAPRGNGFNNLVDFRAIGGGGAFAGRGLDGPITLATGSFSVAADAPLGATSEILMDWRRHADTGYNDVGEFDPVAAGAFKINGGYDIKRTKVDSVDEVVYGYQGLTLMTVPEPASLSLMLLALGILTRKRQDRV